MSGIGTNYLSNKSYEINTNNSNFNTNLNNSNETKSTIDSPKDDLVNKINDSFELASKEKPYDTKIKTEYGFIETYPNTKIEAESPESKTKANIMEYDSNKHVSSKNADFFYVNGIMTDPEDAKKTASILSGIMNKPVTSLWSKKEGFLGDLIKAVKIDQENEIKSVSSETTSEITTRVLYSLRTGKNIKLIAHSRGASEMANALWDVRSSLSAAGRDKEEINKMMSHIEVITIGGLASVSDFPSDVKLTQITNQDDPVPKLNKNKINYERKQYSKFEVILEQKTRENNGKHLNQSERFSLYKQNIDFREAGCYTLTNIRTKINTLVDVLYAKTSHILAKTSIGKSENGSRLIISKTEPNALGIVISSHLVNAGSNNYLGQEDIQDFLRKVASD